MSQRVSPTPSGAPAGTAAAVVQEDLEHICGSLKEELEAMRGRRLLVTGGAGFLGHYFVQAVLHANRSFEGAPIRLTVFDSFVRGRPAWLTRLEGDPDLTVVRHDMTQPLPASTGDYEFVIHAASIASPTYYRRHPIATMDANVNGLRALLDHARAQQERGTPLGGFLFLSSSEIYGDPSPEHIPTPETYRGYVSCTGPRACYDEAKRYGETLCVNFAAEFGLPVRMARPFNNYGPGLKISDRRVLPDFARDILAGRDIVMLSDGSPRRTFCYVADAIIGYYKVLVRGRSGEAYNVGVEQPEVSMAEVGERMARLARDLFGYPGKVVRGESQDAAYLVDNPNRRCPVITKARSELGYDPVVGLDEGLRRSLVWYRENASAEDA
jgi:nucleoside-diphosphate-sugar epimerase